MLGAAIAPDMMAMSGALLAIAVAMPVIGILLSLALGGRQVERIALVLLAINLGLVAIILAEIWQTGRALTYIVGGWAPPLGITLRADGLSAMMMLTAAIVLCVVGIYARADFGMPAGALEARAPFVFWILLAGLCGAMNMVCLGSDLFTLYVAIELLTFAAVPLVCLDGHAETLQSALRYLLFAAIGSILYLLGIALLYSGYGTLDIATLSREIRADNVTIAATALMTAGLLAKTALFPLHFWLPPAHAGAPAAASAILSALVIKGSFFLVVRLWFDVAPQLPGATGVRLLGALGAGAILFGNLLALRQGRLKLLVAYSTVAQIGYLFMVFPLSIDATSAQLQNGVALSGGILQAIAHAMAKAAMFMAAGLVYATFGHDRVAGLAGVGRALPLTVVAFACGGFSLIGLPPSGGYLAKWLLLEPTRTTSSWEVVMFLGSLLTTSYVFLVLLQMCTPIRTPLKLRAQVPRYQQVAALALGLGSALLGLFASSIPDIMLIGRDAATSIASVADTFSISATVKAVAPALLGAALAIGLWYRLAPDQHASEQTGRIGYAAVGFGAMLDRADTVLRQWHVATLLLLLVILALGAAMLTAR